MEVDWPAICRYDFLFYGDESEDDLKVMIECFVEVYKRRPESLCRYE